MSWYYSYYAGFKNKNNMLYPLGMVDYKRQMHPIISKSRSFASDLHEEFWRIDNEGITLSDEFIKAIRSEFDYMEDEEFDTTYVSYLPLKDLHYKRIEKRGYFLIEDINRYLKDGYIEDGFYDYLTPEVYAMKMENELKFGPPQPTKDCEGYEYTPRSAREYSYFVYIDPNSVEYETNQLLDAMEIYEFTKIPEDAEKVFVLIEG